MRLRLATAQWLRVWVWALICVLPFAGLTTLQRQLLGPLHRHHPELAALQQAVVAHLRSIFHAQALAQRAGHFQLSQNRAPDARVHQHHHGSAQRHHHDVGDDTVRPLETNTPDSQQVASPLINGPFCGLPCDLRAGLRHVAPAWRAPHLAVLAAGPPLRPPRG